MSQWIRYIFYIVLSNCLVAGLYAQAPQMQKQKMYQEGIHYFNIEPAQQTQSTNPVEVIEVFSYACGACNLFQGNVDAWRNNSASPKVAFSYLPAAWNDTWEIMARGFYAAESLGVVNKTHGLLFKALHTEHKKITSKDDLAAWYAEAAEVNEADFLATMDSFAVNAKIKRAQQMVPRYGVEGTPSVIVAGKYRVTGESAGSASNVFDVVNFLVNQEMATQNTLKTATGITQ